MVRRIGRKLQPTTIRLSKLDKVIEVLTLLVFIGIVMFLIITWNKLPSVIPIHFNAIGEVDDYGSKGFSIGFMMIIMIGMYIGISALTRYPQLYNYSVEINATNMEVQHRMAMTFLRIIKFDIILWFSYIQYSTVNVALHKASGLGKWLIPTVFIILILSLGTYVISSIRMKNGKKRI